MLRNALVLIALFGLTAPTPAGEPSTVTDATRSAADAAQASAGVDTTPLVTEAVINAPVSEVWKVFTTAEGFKKLGSAKAEIDFRVGGLMRSHYDPKGTIGDPGTIENQIIAYEPERMLAFRIHTPPKGFPFLNAYKSMWSVATFTDLGDGRTHLRLAQVGYTEDEESQKMRAFFKSGNDWVMKKLQYGFDANAKPATGAAHAEGTLSPIELTQIIDAPRSEVFKAMTTSPGWKSALGADSKIELKLNGPFEIYFGGASAPEGERGSDGCVILSYVPNEMFSFTWNAPPKLAFARTKRTQVVVRLEEVSPAVTRVKMVQHGFAELAAEYPDHAKDFEETRAYFTNAWPRVLGAFAEHFKKTAKAG
jgi:uncharacterized protein YndB with AHSA1/START domain